MTIVLIDEGIVFIEEIELSTYRENDTPAHRLTANLNGHHVQVVHEHGHDKATVMIDETITQMDVDQVPAYVRRNTGKP